uniref:Uncharacterized protein n=1 Tax=Oryza sativa subsp. japonica TaxID=39947 RepID=Q67V15_ORYSJ|nr:hypothetical protein [Oryza sativa Japonica Group]
MADEGTVAAAEEGDGNSKGLGSGGYGGCRTETRSVKKTTAMVDEGAAAATKDEGGVCRQPCGRGQQRWRQTRTATQWSATAAMAE